MKQYGQLTIPGLLPQRREDSLRRTEILPPQSSVNNVSWLYRLRLSFAQETACVRFSTAIFLKRLYGCVLTVFSLMNNERAISLLDAPIRSLFRISFSR